jgi:hypothetical protein
MSRSWRGVYAVAELGKTSADMSRSSAGGGLRDALFAWIHGRLSVWS